MASSFFFWHVPFVSDFCNICVEIMSDRFVIAILFFLIGMGTLLVIEVFLIMMQLRDTVQPPPTSKQPAIKLPEILKDRLSTETLNQKEDCVWFNFLTQFLFAELRDSVEIRRFFTKKIEKEFEEVLTSRTGVFMDELFLRDYTLGDKFPIFTDVSVDKCDVKDDIIEILDIRACIVYDGGFEISIDAALPFGRTAYIAVKLLKLSGDLRIRFTNLPFSHWSFSFYEEPEIELDVSAQLDGRPVLKLKNVISHQIRKIIRKKHMLPMYKIRYKPFFRPESDILPSVPENLQISGVPIASGLFEVTLKGASKLPVISKGAQIYCTLSTDPLPWKQMMTQARLKRPILTKELVKSPNDPSLGLILKDDIVTDRLHPVVLVQEVLTGAPAHLAGVKQGEIIVTVNGNRVTSAKQATKLLKSNKERLTIQVESNSQDKNAENTQPPPTSIGGGSEEQSRPVTDGTEPPTGSQEEDSSSVSSQVDQKWNTQKTKLKPSPENPVWDQQFVFGVDPSMAYLNICVWSRGGDRSARTDIIGSSSHDVLVGHVNLNLDDIYLHCLLTLSGTLHDKVKLKHGHYQTETELAKEWSSHKGWNPDLMYGDLTLAFHFAPSLLSDKQRHNLTSTNFLLKQNLTKEVKLGAEVKMSPKKATQMTDIITDSINYTQGHHQFDSTSFITATFCDYCGKKIWMKEAFKCRTCSMVCHKKCLVKCLVNTFCTEDGVRKRTATEELWAPLSVSHRSRPSTSENADTLDGNTSDRDCSRETSRERANRSENAHDDELRSPSRFRNLKDRTERIKDNVVRSIRKNKTPTTLNDKVIMDAKELGAQLFSDLEPTQRRDKLDELITQLDEQLKLEMKNKEELDHELDSANTAESVVNESKRRNDIKTLENKIDKSTDRLNTMRLRMLQYCTALQVSMKESDHAGEDLEKLDHNNPAVVAASGVQQPNSRVSYMGGFVKRASSSVKEKMSSIRKDLGKKGHSVKVISENEEEWNHEDRKNNSRTLSSIIGGFTSKGDKNQAKSELKKQTEAAEAMLVLREESNTKTIKIPEQTHARSRSLVDESLLLRHDDVDVLPLPGSLPSKFSLPQINVGADDDDDDDENQERDDTINDFRPTNPVSSKIARSNSDSRLEVNNKQVDLHPDDILRYHGNSLPKVLVSEDDNSESDDYFILDSSDENDISDFSEDEVGDGKIPMRGLSDEGAVSEMIVTPEDVIRGNIRYCVTSYHEQKQASGDVSNASRAETNKEENDEHGEQVILKESKYSYIV